MFEDVLCVPGAHTELKKIEKKWFGRCLSGQATVLGSIWRAAAHSGQLSHHQDGKWTGADIFDRKSQYCIGS